MHSRRHLHPGFRAVTPLGEQRIRAGAGLPSPIFPKRKKGPIRPDESPHKYLKYLKQVINGINRNSFFLTFSTERIFLVNVFCYFIDSIDSNLIFSNYLDIKGIEKKEKR